MKRDTFLKHSQALMTARTKLLHEKGEAYSGDEDVFANFKNNAERAGLSKYQVWLIYASKHIDSITNAIKRCPAHPVDPSEGLRGRIEDAQNYLDLFYGMLLEDGLVRPDKLLKAYPLKDHNELGQVDFCFFNSGNYVDIDHARSEGALYGGGSHNGYTAIMDALDSVDGVARGFGFEEDVMVHAHIHQGGLSDIVCPLKEFRGRLESLWPVGE